MGPTDGTWNVAVKNPKNWRKEPGLVGCSHQPLKQDPGQEAVEMAPVSEEGTVGLIVGDIQGQDPGPGVSLPDSLLEGG